MPYLIETVEAGRVIEKRKKYSARYGIKGIPRSDNFRPTPPDVEKVNQDNAERQLRWLINENYKEDDFHIILEFDKRWNPSPEEAIPEYEKFLREARKLYRAEGIEFKYIAAMERGQRGAHKIHFHLVINYLETKKISAIWPWARVKYFPLDDSGQYGKLAAYIIKRTSKTFRSGLGFKKRWNHSKNLRVPVPKNKVVSRQHWLKEPRAKWGYYIEKDKTYNGISEKTGYPTQFYSMVQLKDCRKSKRKRE